MHRSGTSAITRVLNLLGAQLSQNLLPANNANELGYWEPSDAVNLHDRMLASAGSAWDNPFGVEPSWFETRAVEHFCSEIVDFVQSEFADAPLFVVKDPRIALLIPVWLKALERLDIEPLFVIPFRSPLEVERSLMAREANWPAGQGNLLWLRYVLTAEAATRGHARSFVFYDAALTDWRAEANRIGAQLGVIWPRQGREADVEIDGFLNPDQKHNTVPPADIGDDEQNWSMKVFAQLQLSSRHPADGADIFADASRALSAATAIYGDYAAAMRLLTAGAPALKRDLADKEREIGALREIAEARENSLAERTRELQQAAGTLAIREAEAATHRQELTLTREELGLRVAEIVQRDEELTQRDQALAGARADLGRTALEAEALRQEIAQIRAEKQALERELATQAAEPGR